MSTLSHMEDQIVEHFLLYKEDDTCKLGCQQACGDYYYDLFWTNILLGNEAEVDVKKLKPIASTIDEIPHEKLMDVFNNAIRIFLYSYRGKSFVDYH